MNNKGHDENEELRSESEENTESQADSSEEQVHGESSESIGNTSLDDEQYYESIEDVETVSKKKGSFLVELFDLIENFNLRTFKNKLEIKKENTKERKRKAKELKESSTTVDDVRNQRKQAIKHVFYKLGVLGFVMILITGAIIYALQDNEKMQRPNIDTKKLINDTTSFGGIDQKDYFLEQNVLDDKINLVEKNAKEGREQILQQVNESTKTITKHFDTSIKELGEKQVEGLQKTKEEILSVVDDKIKRFEDQQSENVKKLENRVKKYSDIAQLKLVNGKIVFPGQDGKSVEPQKPLISSTNSFSETNETSVNKPIEVEEEYIVDISSDGIQTMTFDTGMKPPEDENKSENIEFDLTTSLVRVTLIDGVKAAALSVGLDQPSPVLMTIEGVKYAANDHTDTTLKGCLLRGVGIGNINTSRVEIFGTHLSCVIEAESGKLYKVEHDFPKNDVWIKGEDGAGGVSGDIVDSSGKILSKSAAMGFLQGLSNYFSAQNLVTGGTATLGGAAPTAQLGTSMQSGIGSGVQTSFDMIIQYYEKILQGYYPFIDVKGGRKNLTAVFGGKTKLIATPYKEADFENY